MKKTYVDISQKFEFLSPYTESDLLVHYTTFSALQGIVENKELWFTNSKYLNDISEGKYFKDLYYKELDKFEKGNNICESLRNVLHDKNMFIRETVFLENGEDVLTDKLKISKSEVYVCCFSTEKDSLPMWNYYGKSNNSAGVNICLNRHTLFNDNLNNYEYQFFKVVYDEEEQKKILQQNLSAINNKWSENKNNVLAYYLKDFLNTMNYICKAPCFAYENEVRCVIHVPVEEKKNIKFRTNNSGILVPYINVPINIEDPALMISSLSNFDLVKNSLEIFLMNNNIDQFSIDKSQCPVRW